MNGARIGFIITGVVIVVAVACGLIGGAFSVLENTQYGIAIDGTYGRVDYSKIYTAGRYALGLGWYFIKYPTTVVSVSYDTDTKTPIVARSKDGVLITMDCSFEYRLLKDELFSLFFKYGADYELPISKVARETIRGVASQYEAFGFFLNRSAISADMFQSLRDDLEQNHALLNSFQLLDITLPAAFASAIQTTEITRQQISTAQFQKERALVESATQVLAASQQAQVITARASADSQVILAQAQAQAAAINSRTTNLLNAYLTIKSNYSMTEDELLSYIWLQALSETQASVTYSYRKPGSLNY